jgi:hypothetical protein
MTSTQSVRVAAVLVAAMIAGCAVAADPEEEAVQAATEWLALVDDGDYELSWDRAAAYFRNAVTRESWKQSLDAVRAPLGEVQSRKVGSAQYATSLPGAPDGEYVVIEFNTSFVNKSSAVERVTPMKDPDGTWRVSGCFIR